MLKRDRVPQEARGSRKNLTANTGNKVVLKKQPAFLHERKKSKTMGTEAEIPWRREETR